MWIRRGTLHDLLEEVKHRWLDKLSHFSASFLWNYRTIIFNDVYDFANVFDGKYRLDCTRNYFWSGTTNLFIAKRDSILRAILCHDDHLLHTCFHIRFPAFRSTYRVVYTFTDWDCHAVSIGGC